MTAPRHDGRGPGLDANDLAHRFCPAMYAAANLVALYGTSSQVAAEAVSNLRLLLDEIAAEEGSTSLGTSGERVIVNEHRLRPEAEGFVSFRYVIDLLRPRRIGTIHFGAGVSDFELGRFLEALLKVDPAAEDPLGDLELFLEMGEVRDIRVVAEATDLQHEPEPSDAPIGPGEAALRAYRRLLFAYGLASESLATGAPVDLRPCARGIETVVDLLELDDAPLVALTGMKGAGGFRCAHAVNVAVLVLAMGHRLGMQRGALAKLGLAALFHDVARDGSADDPHHAARGALVVLHSFELTDSGLRCAAAALQHHAASSEVSPLGASLEVRLIAVADVFDSATTPDPELGESRAAQAVLARMARVAADRLDPDVVALLSHVIGPRTLGSWIELDDGRTGVVVPLEAPGSRGVRITSENGDPAVNEYVDVDLRGADGTPLHPVRSYRPPYAVYASLDALVAAL